MQAVKKTRELRHTTLVEARHFHVQGHRGKTTLNRHGLTPSHESVMVFDRMAAGLKWIKKGKQTAR